jgi:hypothetical protein
VGTRDEKLGGGSEEGSIALALIEDRTIEHTGAIKKYLGYLCLY